MVLLTCAGPGAASCQYTNTDHAAEEGKVGSVRQSSFSKTANGLFQRARYQSLS